MTTRTRHDRRRRWAAVEEAVLLDRQVTEPEVREGLVGVTDDAHDGAFTAVRLDALAAVAAGRRPRADYVDAYGACGVRRFVTARERVLFRLPVETFPEHVNNLYLVDDRAGALLVDAATRAPSARADLARAGRVLAALHDRPGALDAVRDVVITHAHLDHFAGAAAWRESGARVHAHELDARALGRPQERAALAWRALRRFLAEAGVAPAESVELEARWLAARADLAPCPIDRALVDGDEVAGAVVHHVPGHAPGHVVLQVDDILCTADHVLPRITPLQIPESLAPGGGLDAYLRSLSRVRALPGVALGLPGHGDPIPDVPARIDEIEAFHRDRLARVRAACAGEPRTIAGITRALFGEVEAFGRLLALQEVGAHVEHLARRGRLAVANLDEVRARDDAPIAWRDAG